MRAQAHDHKEREKENNAAIEALNAKMDKILTKVNIQLPMSILTNLHDCIRTTSSRCHRKKVDDKLN